MEFNGLIDIVRFNKTQAKDKINVKYIKTAIHSIN